MDFWNDPKWGIGSVLIIKHTSFAQKCSFCNDFSNFGIGNHILPLSIVR